MSYGERLKDAVRRFGVSLDRATLHGGTATDTAVADAVAPAESPPRPSTPSPRRLEVTDLEKSFDGAFSVSGVDLHVETDEIVALLGPSGCGKTTILRCIAGVETPDSGDISIDGDRVCGDGRSVSPEERNVGMVYQSYAIWPHKTVFENVVFPLEHTDNDVPTSEYESRVDEVLRLLEIDELKRSPATDLSGGQQQRTALARSLVHDPDLLLMDEPLSNLDRGLRRDMRYELQRLQSELGLSILYVTHDQEEAFYLSDRVLVMNDGAIVERGTPRELYHRPRSQFTRRFVGQQNCFDGVVEETSSGDRVVRTAALDIPLDKADYVANGTDPADAGSVTCFVRPADVTVGRFSRSSVNVLELHGTVIAEGVLGDRYEITARFGNEVDLVIHTRNYQQVALGDNIHVHLKPSAVQVYPDTSA